MSARDVIEMALNTAGLDNVRDDDAPHIIEALTVSGYRILAPGELDAATIEVCVRAGDAWFSATKDVFAKKHGQNFIAELRNLGASNG